jgi:hypothetical protein
MLLINDGFFWDDNLIYVLYETKNYDELYVWALEMGSPLSYFYMRANDYFFGLSNHRLISFISIVISSVLAYEIFKYYSQLSKLYCLAFISLFVGLYPFKTTVLLSTLQYQLSFLLFLLAVFLRAEFSSHNKFFIGYIASALFIFLSLASFATASVLVLYCFYMMFDYFYTAGCNSKSFNFRFIYFYFRKNLLLLSLPFIYWAVKFVYFPVHGLYSDYNSIGFDFIKMVGVFKDFFEGVFVYGSIYNLWFNSPRSIFVLLLIFLFASLILGKCTHPSARGFSGWHNHSYLIFWSSMFILFTALPYMLVNASPSFEGWNSRHYILWTVSLPVFVFTVLYVYFDRIRVLSGATSLNFVLYSSIFCVALSGIISSNYVYLGYQVQAIKQHAVVENLKERPDLKIYSGFWIDDQISNFNNNYPSNAVPYQAWYEWAAIFRKAWGAEKWYGNNINMNEDRMVSARYGASEINPDGLRCTVILKSSSNYGRSGVVRRYFTYKYFGTEMQLKQFLLSIVSLDGCK